MGRWHGKVRWLRAPPACNAPMRRSSLSHSLHRCSTGRIQRVLLRRSSSRPAVAGGRRAAAQRDCHPWGRQRPQRSGPPSHSMHSVRAPSAGREGRGGGWPPTLPCHQEARKARTRSWVGLQVRQSGPPSKSSMHTVVCAGSRQVSHPPALRHGPARSMPAHQRNAAPCKQQGARLTWSCTMAAAQRIHGQCSTAHNSGAPTPPPHLELNDVGVAAGAQHRNLHAHGRQRRLVLVAARLLARELQQPTLASGGGTGRGQGGAREGPATTKDSRHSHSVAYP